MKKLVKSIARFLGYEIHKIAPPSPAITDFLNAPEAEFETDAGEGARGPGGLGEIEVPREPGQATASLIVEGWRFIPHSYAIVNQWQLLSLMRRASPPVKLLDAPLYNPRWQRQEGMFEPQAERLLKSIPAAAPDESADLMLRLFFPFDFSLSRSRRTAVFGTLEAQAILKSQCTDFRVYERFRRGVAPAEVQVVTPSRWSAEGFYKIGFRTEQVHVIPHGVDTATFHPMPDIRAQVRNRLSIPNDDFVFLSVSSLTANKGIDLLLQAFAEVSRKFPHARLVLKGMNPLYNSRDHLLKILQKVPARDQPRIVERMKFFGNSYSNRKMALLYQAADTYVSPYLAEGFNMPVLEAAACGLPIICTRGGPTDDFVTDAFAHRIESVKIPHNVEDQEFTTLKPDVEHLIGLMCSAIQDGSWRSRAAKEGPAHVRARYTWDHVVDILVRDLMH